MVPKNAQIATSFTPCSIICVNFLRHTQKCSCQEVQKLYSTKFSHHMHQRQTDQCELITRRSQAVVFACAYTKNFGLGRWENCQKVAFCGLEKQVGWTPPEGAYLLYYFLEIHKVCPEKWSDRMLLYLIDWQLLEFYSLGGSHNGRLRGAAKGSIYRHPYILYIPSYALRHLVDKNKACL